MRGDIPDMGMNQLIDEIRETLIRNEVSPECTAAIVKLLAADKFKRLDDIDNNYADILKDIKSILEDDTLDDFDCIEKIVVNFERSGIRVSCRHDF